MSERIFLFFVSGGGAPQNGRIIIAIVSHAVVVMLNQAF
jgi:hypothetical protein